MNEDNVNNATIIVTEQDRLAKSPKKQGLQEEEKKGVDQRKLELAMQVLKEARKDEEPAEEDPYTKMSKRLDVGGGARKEKRNFALRQATEEQEEEKKGG